MGTRPLASFLQLQGASPIPGLAEGVGRVSWIHRGLGEGRMVGMTFHETEMEQTEEDVGLGLPGPVAGSHGASQDAALLPCRSCCQPKQSGKNQSHISWKHPFMGLDPLSRAENQSLCRPVRLLPTTHASMLKETKEGEMTLFEHLLCAKHLGTMPLFSKQACGQRILLLGCREECKSIRDEPAPVLTSHKTGKTLVPSSGSLYTSCRL